MVAFPMKTVIEVGLDANRFLAERNLAKPKLDSKPRILTKLIPGQIIGLFEVWFN